MVQYLIAFVVGCHGFTYIPFGLFVPGALKGWRGRSWLLSSALMGDRLKIAVLALHLMAGIAILGCAVAIAAASAVWFPLAVVGAAAGLAAFAVFWDGQAQLLATEGGIGAMISLMLLVSATAFRVFG